MLLMLAVVPPAVSFGFDWADFTAHSERSDDPFLLSALETGDFETRAAICTAIGTRADPDAQALLSWLLAGYSKGKVYQAELLLRLALGSLFDGPPDEPGRAARFSANGAVLSDLAASIGLLEDPQLRGTIVRLLPRLDAGVGSKALMVTGAEILAVLKRTGGSLSPQETSLALDYLHAVKAMGARDFFEPCLEMSRLSRDKSLVTEARGAAAAVSVPHP